MKKGFRDMTKEKYGKLTAIKVVSVKPTMWECLCDCGNTTIVSQGALSSGNTKTCGCSKKVIGAKINIIGNKYSRLTVLSEIELSKRRGKKVEYLCKCDCGKVGAFYGDKIKSGHTQSCGCIHTELMSGARENIIGNKYGKLTVLDELSTHSKGQDIRFLCLCECGTKTEVIGYHLKKGHTKSCGCISSIGEEDISQLLSDNRISFIKEKIYDDLIGSGNAKNSRLRFDFYVSDKYIIEFDGLQHFSYIGGWSNKENFEKTRKHDLMKNKYCFDNNIQIIRIPYNHLNNLKIDDLILETSDFILTQENENIYYEDKN